MRKQRILLFFCKKFEFFCNKMPENLYLIYGKVYAPGKSKKSGHWYHLYCIPAAVHAIVSSEKFMQTGVTL